MNIVKILTMFVFVLLRDVRPEDTYHAYKK